MEIYQKIEQAENFLKNEQLRQAETVLHSIIQQQPYNIRALLLLSEIAKKQNRKLEAISLVEKALILDPTNQSVAHRLQSLINSSEIEIDWINNYLNKQGLINPVEIESILHFSLIWNMFEGIVCNQHASIRELERVVNQLQQRKRISLEEIEPFLSYFKKRYTTNNKINSRFRHLRFRQNDKQDLVKDVLIGKVIDTPNVLLALLIIVYRYRNNLFHGIKSIRTLSEQRDNFRTANRLLMIILENWR